jgi:hypothetical protein
MSDSVQAYAQIMREFRTKSNYSYRMKTEPLSASSQPLGPHCRALRRGVIGDGIDGRSREGKFLRKCEAELIAHCGGSPSFTQRLMIRRCARAMLRLELLDGKMEDGSWTDHDARTFGGLSNNLRLCLRELGLKAAPKDKPLSLADIAARHSGAGA